MTYFHQHKIWAKIIGKIKQYVQKFHSRLKIEILMENPRTVYCSTPMLEHQVVLLF